MTERESLIECDRLRAQRDYYRRRWLVQGLRYRNQYGVDARRKYVAAVMDVLAKARLRDA